MQWVFVDMICKTHPITFPSLTYMWPPLVITSLLSSLFISLLGAASLSHHLGTMSKADLIAAPSS